MPIDYSKWNKIEVSDDEDDTHPNVDTPSLFRWRHQARMEKMAQQQQEKEALEKESTNINDQINQLRSKLEDNSIVGEERDSYEKKLDQFVSQLNEWKDKEKKFEEMLKHEPWNVDTISTEKFSKSRINKPKVVDNKPVTAEEAHENMQNVITKYSKEIDLFKKCQNVSEISNYLRNHPELACEEVASCLTLDALNHAILEEDKDLIRVATNTQYIQYIIQLATELKIPPNTSAMVNRFFDKILSNNEAFKKDHEIQLTEFLIRLRNRGAVKREEALKDIEDEEREARIKASPGGIDPQEVMNALPDELKECFESRDMSKMKHVAETMDRDVFKYHFQRCIDSGLWVPGGNDDGAEAHEETAE
uniref:Hsp90 chaperone protein kinase-targeting subunit n=1 Tax=Rhabditophanes sp. KR3021 TaxID=114890 RepID=A0AC35TG55_9BILA